MTPDANAVSESAAGGAPGLPGVSVVVPSYNHAAYVGKCLHSIMKQTRPPQELTVIDDGSSDGSPRVIEQALKACPFFCELIVRPNKGLCATLNEGLDRSRGKYFAYLGSDDVWLPRFLEARVELLEARPGAVLGYGHTYVIDEADRVIECTRDWARYSDGQAREMLLRGTAPASPTVLYKRDALARRRWDEGSRLEDYGLYLRLCMDGDFAFDPRVLSAWRQHRYNASRSPQFMLRESLDAQRQVMENLGLGAEQLEGIHAALKWKYAADFIKTGQKSKAVGLMCRNLGGAPSPLSVARMTLGLLLPRRAIEWRRSVLQRRAARRYGSVQV